jgi:dTDP-4-amino-4,6-dideoxygalactose transaminase
MIKFLDLQKITASYADELKLAAAEVIDSGWFLQGSQTKDLENNLKTYIGSENAVGVANGLDALKLILQAYIQIGVLKEGDEILVPANTYIATILAITDNKLTPILIEPDLATYNINIQLIARHITDKTKGIIVVHLYGRICWDTELESLISKHGLIAIEDNAQAFGASWGNRKSGNLGDAAGFSFYPGKNLGALGDSGAVLTGNADLGNIVRSLGNYGSSRKYFNDYQGVNSRIDEIQAAFLKVKLKYIDEENQIRRNIANYYCNNIKNGRVILPNGKMNLPVENDLSNVWHLFVIRTNDRELFQNYLLENGIQSLIHYPVPPHKQKCYKEMNQLSFPITELIHKEILSLPISPVMTNAEIEKVVQVVNAWQ